MDAAVFRACDQTGLFEHTQMLRNRRQGHGKRGGKVAHRGVARRQALKHSPPGRMGERCKDFIECVRCIFNHMVKYTSHAGQREKSYRSSPLVRAAEDYTCCAPLEEHTQREGNLIAPGHIAEHSYAGWTQRKGELIEGHDQTDNLAKMLLGKLMLDKQSWQRRRIAHPETKDRACNVQERRRRKRDHGT